MRLFVGIELQGAGRDEVLRVREQLVQRLTRQGVRFVRPEKLHLTLAFLGDVESERLPALREAMRALSRFETIELYTSPVGAFPDLRRPKVVWIGLEDPQEDMRTLVEEVRRLTAPFSPERDDKPFSPHITLARVTPGSKEVGRSLLSEPPKVLRSALPILAVTLFHSQPNGEYAKVEDVALKGLDPRGY